MMTRLTSILPCLLITGLVAGCAHSPPSDPWDPLEPANRVSYKITDTADTYALRPVAKGYNKVVPDPVQTSVGNFFANVGQPVTMVNSLLQLKWGKFNQSLGRFLINTTAGLGGLFDVASKLDVAHPQEDFGQTLGYWGIGPGVYLYIPFLGPSDGRDAIGRVADVYSNPITYLDEIDTIDDHYAWLPYVLYGVKAINLRASLLGFDQTLEQQFDPYVFLRGYYLEKRLQAVHDGHVPERLKGGDNDYPLPEPVSS
jgi:phospholipid-binding lipoprotein MlaA